MISAPEVLVKGALIRARLQYIGDRYGQVARGKAETDVSDKLGASHGILLASQWYPAEVTDHLDHLITEFSRGDPKFTWHGLGASEARTLSEGPLAPMMKKSPELMATHIPRLYTALYNGLQVTALQKEPKCIEYRFQGRRMLQHHVECQGGFIEQCLAASGALGAKAEINPARDGLRVLIRWASQAKQRLCESIRVDAENRILDCRNTMRRVCKSMGFGNLDLVALMTCVSELARNTVNYAGEGTIHIEDTERGGKRCLHLRAEDKGPGIPHLQDVMEGNYRSSEGLGRGLIAVKRLSDEFTVRDRPGGGVSIEVVKYLQEKP